jgi:translation initiation factor 1A
MCCALPPCLVARGPLPSSPSPSSSLPPARPLPSPPPTPHTRFAQGEEKRELIQKEDGQEYAKVLRMLGNGRLEAQCFDGETRQCHIRGKMRKKVWVSAGDIILISLRDFQDGKADVILKYSADEARSLKALGQLPDSVVINDAAEGDEEEGGYQFAEDSDSGGEVNVDAI